MDGYRQFWSQIFYGTDRVAVGTYDTTEYWIRLLLVVAICLLAGVASRRFSWLTGGVTGLALALYVLSVGPFLAWSATCGGCGSSASYDTPRSFEVMLINAWWGGLLAIAVAATWIGAWAERRFL